MLKTRLKTHNAHPSGFARLCFCFEMVHLSNAVFWFAVLFRFRIIFILPSDINRNLRASVYKSQTLSDKLQTFKIPKTLASSPYWAVHCCVVHLSKYVLVRQQKTKIKVNP